MPAAFPAANPTSHTVTCIRRMNVRRFQTVRCSFQSLEVTVHLGLYPDIILPGSQRSHSSPTAETISKCTKYDVKYSDTAFLYNVYNLNFQHELCIQTHRLSVYCSEGARTRRRWDTTMTKHFSSGLDFFHRDRTWFLFQLQQDESMSTDRRPLSGRPHW